MLNQAVRLRDLPQNPKWKAVSDADTMIVHVVMPKAEEAAATPEADGGALRAAAPPSPKSSRRARPRRKARKRRSSADCEIRQSMKLIVGLRQSRRRVSRHAAQRRLHGGRRDRAAAQLTSDVAPSQMPDAFVAKQFGPARCCWPSR